MSIEADRTHKIRLYPTPEQAAVFTRHAAASGVIYNELLRYINDSYDHARRFGYAKGGFGVKTTIPWNEISSAIPMISDQIPWLRQCYQGSLSGNNAAFGRLNKAFKNFFDKIGGYPRFKNRDANKSFYLPAPAFKVIDKVMLKLPAKFFKPKNWVKMAEPLRTHVSLGGVTISGKNGRWWASFVMKVQLAPQVLQPGVLGIDRGVKHTLTTSTPSFHDIPRPELKAAHKIRFLERRLAKSRDLAIKRKVKLSDSKNYQKLKLKLGRLKERHANIKYNWCQKTTTDLIRRGQTIGIEALEVQNMTRSAKGKNVRAKSGLNRAILASNWGEIERQLEYKAKAAGLSLVKVAPQYTSQTCSTCGFVDSKNRPTQGEFLCLRCGFEENADINAARNIAKTAESTLVMPTGMAERPSRLARTTASKESFRTQSGSSATANQGRTYVRQHSNVEESYCKMTGSPNGYEKPCKNDTL